MEEPNEAKIEPLKQQRFKFLPNIPKAKLDLLAFGLFIIWCVVILYLLLSYTGQMTMKAEAYGNVIKAADDCKAAVIANPLTMQKYPSCEKKIGEFVIINYQTGNQLENSIVR